MAKEIVYIRCPVCGSLRRWDKGGWSRTLYDLHFMVQTIHSEGRGRLWNEWRRLSIRDASDIGTGVFLMMVIKRLEDALERVKKQFEEVLQCLVERKQRGELKEEPHPVWLVAGQLVIHQKDSESGRTRTVHSALEQSVSISVVTHKRDRLTYSSSGVEPVRQRLTLQPSVSLNFSPGKTLVLTGTLNKVSLKTSGLTLETRNNTVIIEKKGDIE